MKGKRVGELEASISVGTGLLALIGVLAESQLLLELATELAIRSHKLLARVDQGLAWGNCSVSLDPNHHLGHVGMGNYGPSG